MDECGTELQVNMDTSNILGTHDKSIFPLANRQRHMPTVNTHTGISIQITIHMHTHTILQNAHIDIHMHTHRSQTPF